MKSDDEENKVPYSPRVQGAGIANTANAMKTPVILYADSGKTKPELGDRLSDTIEISFTAENLTGNDVVYDKISAVALTDGYVTQNGKNYISNTRPLPSEWIADFDTVTVPANSSVTVSAQIKLDPEELNENYLIFSNGFYIDGFIRLENFAFYDEDGSLMHTDIMQNQSVSAGEYAFTGDFDASTADYCKLFIWEDTKNVTPMDSAKVFDLEMYEIIQK